MAVGVNKKAGVLELLTSTSNMLTTFEVSILTPESVDQSITGQIRYSVRYSASSR